MDFEGRKGRPSEHHLRILGISLIGFLLFISTGEAFGDGFDLPRSQIGLIDRASGDTLRNAQVGDTIVVNVIVNGVMGQTLTGVEFYIRFDPEFLIPIDADNAVSGLQPVRSEGLITGSNEIANEFNTVNPNKYNGIIYAEGLLSGITSSDSGLVASISFEMIQPITHGGK